MIQVNIASLTELYHYGSLPEKVVSIGTVNCFKEQLDRFWSNKEIYFNYKANILCN